MALAGLGRWRGAAPGTIVRLSRAGGRPRAGPRSTATNGVADIAAAPVGLKRTTNRRYARAVIPTRSTAS